MNSLRRLSALVATLAGLSVVAWQPWKSAKGGSVDETSFFYDVLWELNEDRDLIGQPDLVQDVQLQAWAGEVLGGMSGIGDCGTEQILDLLKRDVPSVATAAILVVYADSQDSLGRRLAEWARNLEGDYTHFSFRLFNDEGDPGVGGLAMMVKRLPLFSPRLLGKTSEAFYNICQICSEAHHGKVNPIARSIVLECPKCNQRYDLLAVDMRGRYHRATDFLDGQASEGVFPASLEDMDADERREELFANWEKVLKEFRYVKDFAGINGRRDAWQFATETERYKNGDCEDSSIALADRLISRGFDARVALGRTDRFEGHAWCVVRLDGVEYILETTEAKPDRSSPPTSAAIGRRYVPEFLFDREHLYFLNNLRWSGDYWSESDWACVSYQSQEGPPLAALRERN